MDDFYKKIKDNIKNRPEPEFHENAWQRMQERMQQQTVSPVVRDNRFNKRTVLLLALLLLSSALLNLWLFSRLNNPQNAIQQIYTHQIDTILKTNVIYQRDTIFLNGNNITKVIQPQYSNSKNHNKIFYQTRYNSSRKLFANLNPSAYNINNPFSISELTDSKNKSDSPWNIYKTTPFSKITFANNALGLRGKAGADVNVKQPINYNKIPLEYLATLPLENLIYNQDAPNDISDRLAAMKQIKEQNKKKKLAYHLYQMRPKSIALGFNGGTIFSTQNILSLKTGLITGLEADIIFSENLRLFTEFSYTISHYKKDQMGDKFGIPVTPSPSDDFEFFEARVELPAIQYSVGLEYLFTTKNKARPYIGIGVNAMSTLPYEVQYEFQKGIDDLELLVDKELKKKTLISNQLLIKFGLEYPLKNKWSLNFTSFYRYNLKDNDFGPPNSIGLKTGLLYHFNRLE